jgi:hypothetical protein
MRVRVKVVEMIEVVAVQMQMVELVEVNSVEMLAG